MPVAIISQVVIFGRMSCTLRARGKNFDPVSFLRRSTLKPCFIFSRGEQTRAGKIRCDSGFDISLSTVFGILPPQLKQAQIFLSRHFRELQKLKKRKGVTDLRLVLTFCPGNVINTEEFFPAKLLNLLGRLHIGLELSVYPGSNKWLYEPIQDHEKPLKKFIERKIRAEQKTSVKRAFAKSKNSRRPSSHSINSRRGTLKPDSREGFCTKLRLYG